MTMQTTTLPFQVAGAGAQAQSLRPASAGVQAPEAALFSATLSRAMAPTQAPTPAPASAQKPAPAASQASKPAAPAKQADKPAAQGPKSAGREPARQNEAAADAPETARQAGSSARSADAAEDAAAAAESATTPVTDMLAFMASLTQAPAAPAVAAPAAADAASAGGAELQLAALQSAFARLDTAAAVANAAADAAAGTAVDPALAAAEGDAAGFSLAAGVQPAEQDGADLRTPQQAQAAAPADPGKALPHARDGAGAAPEIEAPAPALTQLQAQAAKLETLPNPAAVAGAAGDRIPARLGTQAWDNQISQRIVYMVGKEQAATLTLNPPDLGPVQVVLNVSNDQASVAFSSNQLEVRQALENALPRLREMMGESGIALGNASVDAGTPDQRQAQQDGERGNGGSGGGYGGVGNTAAANDDSAARPATRTVHLGDNGLVDTFA